MTPAWAIARAARWDNAGTGSNYDNATNSFTAAGKKELANTRQTGSTTCS